MVNCEVEAFYNTGGFFLNKNLKIISVTLLLFLTFITLISYERIVKPKNIISEPQTKTENESIVFSFEHPQTKQKFKIIKAHKIYQSYIDKVKNIPNNTHLDIYREEVIKPIYSDCFQNGEFIYMANPILDVVPNIAETQTLIEKINSEDTDKMIKEALLKSSDLIGSDKETTVCVLPSTNVNYATMVTVGAGKIIVLYNRYYSDDVLRAGVAHEYHHSVWTEKYFNENLSFSVLDNLIFEGKAVMFEKLVYPDIDFTTVDLTYNKDNWLKIAPDLEKYDLNRSLEIIGGGKELPWLYGYSEGYKMVKSYLDLNPHVTPDEWTALSTKDIFEKGKYLEHYK